MGTTIYFQYRLEPPKILPIGKEYVYLKLFSDGVNTIKLKIERQMKNQNKRTYYIYGWCLDKKTLYIGKGTESRVYSSDSAVKNFFRYGYDGYDEKIYKRIIFYNLTHEEALELENMVISYFGKRVDNSGQLLNQIGGNTTVGKDTKTFIYQIINKFPNARYNWYSSNKILYEHILFNNE